MARAAVAVGVAGSPLQDKGRWKRAEFGGRNGWRLDAGAGGGANEAHLPGIGEEGVHRITAPGGELRQVLDQQRQGDLEGIDPCSFRNLQPQCLQDLGDEHNRQHLLLDHHWLGTPEEVQPQVGLPGIDCQLDLPITLPPKSDH